ncbi:MAG: hypothetical protein OEY20_18135, partial [Gemmatimonadota bacterium]|nr:hypothetical protein [Gemmatimonadota bacterium]
LDDALIAEWVDGAIAANSPHYAAIGAHVDQCEECRARVEEERALAGHVRQLLGVASPPERVPAFEEVLHRAGAAPKRAKPPLVPLRRLAWAATVMVAGGVGWYARGILMRSGVETQQAPSATVVLRDQDTIGATGAAGLQDRPSEEAPVDAAAPRLEVAAVDAVGRGAAATETQQAETGNEGQRQVMEGDAGRREAMTGEAEALRERVAARRDAAPAAAPAVAQPRPLAQAPVTAENELRMQKAAVAVSWLPTTQADAERVLGRRLLVVPELAIAAVEITADSGAIRVRQDLGGGGTLELVQSKALLADEAFGQAVGGVMAAEPQAGAAQQPSAVETVVIDGVQVVARAAVSGDSLRVLVGRVRARGGA